MSEHIHIWSIESPGDARKRWTEKKVKIDQQSYIATCKRCNAIREFSVKSEKEPMSEMLEGDIYP